MKKYFVACIIAVVATLLIVTVSLISRPLSLQQEDIENAVSVLSDVQLSAANGEIDEHYQFQTEGMDAQLYITGIEGEVGVLVVDFAEPLPSGTVTQLFYSSDGEEMSELHSVVNRLWEDSDILAIKLPKTREYDVFRLDIDRNYQIEDLAVTKTLTSMDPNKNALTALLKGREKFPLFQMLLCFIILAIEGLLIAWKFDTIKKWIARTSSYIRENWRRMLKAVGLCLGGAAVGSFAWFILYKVGVTHSVSGFTIFYFLASGFAIVAMLLVGRRLGPHPEYGFLIISLCFGLMFAVMEPAKTLLTWDDEIHYGHAVALSYGDTSFCSEPERILITRSIVAEPNLEGRDYCAENLNLLDYRGYGSDTNVYIPTPWNTICAYLPPAGAIWLTRLLNLPFSVTVIAGRIANLLCYAIVILIAIRQLKYGRLLVAALCLNPTVLFLASNYSYDPFCIAFTMLGLCIWMGVYQTEGAQMTSGRATVMLLSLLTGILTKQVYFPLVLITLFLPAEKFRSRDEARRYRGAVLVTVLALVASFIIPLLAGSGTYSDTRGGDDIDAMGQVSFILHHPMTYMNVLAKFLINDYLCLSSLLSNASGCIRTFGYVSIFGLVYPEMCASFYLGLTIAAWFGSTYGHECGERSLPGWLKSLGLILSFGTICIVATSLYCAFTPVGADVILGCQTRYMLPAAFMVIVVTRPTFLKNAISPQKFNAAILCSIMAVLLIGSWEWAQAFL